MLSIDKARARTIHSLLSIAEPFRKIYLRANFLDMRKVLSPALTRKKGKFELAHTGSLFLDEIGELVPTLQVKLLRFLQDRKIERVGGNQSIELDVRIIAATNRDLKQDIENRLFREDLYYRLKVVPLELPALRERRDDIVQLAQYF